MVNRQVQDSDTHKVLIMALSTFTRPEKDTEITKIRKTDYSFHDKSFDSDNAGNSERIYSCTGYYQLEVIPKFIKEYLKQKITDVILLETDETTKDRRAVVLFEGKDIPDKELNLTARNYFVRWLKENLGFDLNIIEIGLDEEKPVDALTELMDSVRELYAKVTDKDQWRLWIDTHGGFRDISTIMVSAARFFATDDKDTIPTSSIFSVYHSQKKEKTDRIVNQTAFYFSETSASLKEFLNYGQYLSISYRPCSGEKPYLFVSYRHDERHLSRTRSLFAKFYEMGIPFWYDEGIEYRKAWADKLEEMNEKAVGFVMLASPSYFQSVECWKEFILAIAVHKYPDRIKNGKYVSDMTGRSDTDSEYAKSDDWLDHFHCFLMEKSPRVKNAYGKEKVMTYLPDKAPSEETPSGLSADDINVIRKLMDDTKVSDDDVKAVRLFWEKREYIKWFKYTGDGRSIANETPYNSEDLDKELTKIRENLQIN